jgi:hypothetical protein
MITLKMISEKFNAWRRYRDAVRELSQFSDHGCAISASAAATSKTSCAARVRAEPTRKAAALRLSGCAKGCHDVIGMDQVTVAHRCLPPSNDHRAALPRSSSHVAYR